MPVSAARAEGRKPSLLRPPGAVPPRLFGQLCIRCGNCVRACPAGIIEAQWETDPIGDWLTPHLSIKADYCREDCNACMQVCPSGAIQRANLDQKPQHPIGLAHVEMDRCLLALNQECRTMCLESCPYQAIHLHKWTWEDDRRYPIIEAQKCPGCGSCKLACTPMDAIEILPPGVEPRNGPSNETDHRRCGWVGSNRPHRKPKRSPVKKPGKQSNGHNGEGDYPQGLW
jgi:ferredoxin